MRLPTRLASVALLASTALSHVLPRQESPEDGDTHLLKPETYQLFERVMSTLKLPGAVLAITSPDGGEVISLGVRDGDGTPVTSDTYWPIASNSKLITAVTLASLEEQGLKLPNGQPFTLDTRVIDIDPDFKMNNETATREATVLDFMTHQSGLPGHNLALTPQDTAQVAFDRLDDLKANLGLRQRFQYTNIGFVVATHVVEKLTGRSFYEVADEIVFQPLGMAATWDATEAIASGRLGQGFIKNGVNATQCAIDAVSTSEANSTVTVTFVPESCLGRTMNFRLWTEGTGQEWGGGGAAILTGDDMIIWAKELLNPSKLSPRVVERVQTGVIPIFPLDELPENTSFVPEVALGTLSLPYRDYIMSQHDGALPGSNSLFTRIRNESVGVFVACNDDRLSILFNDAVTKTVLDELLGLAPVDHFGEAFAGAGDPTSGAAVAVPVPPETPRPEPEGYSSDGDGGRHKYKAPGYPEFSLEPLNLTDVEGAHAAGLPLEYLLTDIATSMPVSLRGPAYWARYPASFASHLIISHWDGPLFNCTALLTWEPADDGYASSSSSVSGPPPAPVTKFTGGGPCVFGEDGIGIFGNVLTQNTQLPLPEPVETDIRASAPVFFARV